MKFCIVCNSLTHHTNECTYNCLYLNQGVQLNKVQPQLQNMQKEKPIKRNPPINQDKNRGPPNYQYYQWDEPQGNNY